jgi:hypothetical protein
VDAAKIDRQIGTQIQNGRFGQITAPIYGMLEHMVRLGVSFDDGQGFLAEQNLPANKGSRFLDAGRTSFEQKIEIPAKATRMELYVHVETYLVANYPAGANVTKWYGDGEKVLKADKYDNPDGQPFANYEFSVENK